MPRIAKQQADKLNKFVNIFGPHIFQTDGKTLLCRICSFTIGHDRKSQIEQHLRTEIHRKNLKTTEAGQLRLPEIQHAETYSKELCQAFLNADIPLYKLNNKSLSEFFNKYTKQITPSERTARRFMKGIYDETILKIRAEVGNAPVYIEIDETTDIQGVEN